MTSTLYKQSGNFTHSTGSFLQSAPVELLSVSGYQEFIAKNEKHGKKISTILSEDKSVGYAMLEGQVVATIHGEARDYLLSLSGF